MAEHGEFRQKKIVPKKSGNLSMGLSQSIVLEYIVSPYVMDYLLEALLHIGNFAEFQFAHTQKFHRLRSIEECFCL